LFVARPALAGQEVDFRNGIRTSFYGGRFTGNPPAGDYYGWNMAFGDVDGDGYTDFLASSENAEGPNDLNDHQSDIYLFFGRSEETTDSLYSVDTPGVPDIVFYRGGWAMACGDIDNDGYDDIILSEVLAQSGAYVIFGGPRNQLKKTYNFDLSSPGYTAPDVHIVGAAKLGGDWIITFQGGPQFTCFAVSSGDLNGDHLADIIIGDENYKGPSAHRIRGGAIYVIFGRTREAMPAIINVNPASPFPHPDITIYGEAGDTLPINMTTGDFDGDGVDDLVACSYRTWGEDNMAPSAGEVVGFWGKAQWNSVYDLQTDDFDFALTGNIGDQLGYRLGSGDLDGDSRDDLIVGSPFNVLDDIDRRHMGEFRIYFGRSRDLWPKWGNSVDMTDVMIIGAETGEVYDIDGDLVFAAPISLATGHRNDDKYDDLVLGAGFGRRPGGDRPGRVYLLWGRPRSQWSPFIDLQDGFDTIYYGVDYDGTGAYSFDLFGSKVGMADWDKDGLDDLFLAAQLADGPGNIGGDNGEVYLVFSSDTLATTVSHTPQIATSSLLPNYPNPFNPATTLRFWAPIGVPISLTVYDALGRSVAHPLKTTPNSTENGFVQWNGRDDDGVPLPSGVYFVKLRAGLESHAQKVSLVR
jgi:hypothetical protein